MESRTFPERGRAPTRGLLVLCALLASCGTEKRPNLILVTIDTLRAGHTSLYGYDRETTPAIDAWARGGTVFEGATSMSSWTLPSMHMLLTGQVRIENRGDMREDQHTLAEILQEEGYRTGAVVSNALLNAEQGYDRGFEHYDVIPPPKNFEESNGWTADAVVTKGLAWLDAGGTDERPYFLMLHLYDPHPPFIPSIDVPFPARDEAGQAERRAAMLRALPEDQRELLTDEEFGNVEYNIRLYDTEVLQTDQGLAPLFARLAAENADEDTLVVLTSDHGEGLWQRPPSTGEKLKKGVLFPQLIYGHGTQLYTEQVQVPLVLRGPGVPAAERRAGPSSTLDIVPTVLGRLGLPVPGWMHGVDLYSAEADEERPALFTVCSRWTAVTVDGRWRLHQPAAYRVEKFGAQPELYDLEADPHETTPLDDEALMASLSGLIESWRAAYAREKDGAPKSPEAAARHRELLEAMGYAGQVDPEGDGD